MVGRMEQRARLREEPSPSDPVVVVRGGPDAADKLSRHAARTARAWCLDGLPLHGVSVFLALDEAGSASLDRILETLGSYRLVHLCRVGELRLAGFEVLPTGTRPHFTVRSSGGGSLDVEALLAVIGEGRPNPAYRDRR